jgi:predicted HD phosphohydrolase
MAADTAKAAFTRIDESTREDWQIVLRYDDQHLADVPDRLLAMLRRMGEGEQPYQVTRLEHCLQTATRDKIDLDPDAREEFRGHEWFDACEAFCVRWDCPSFDPSYDSLPLEHFEPMLRRVFTREPFAARRGD